MLLLIVINDCDGTYDETETIIMDCLTTYKLNLFIMSVSVQSLQDNYYTIIPNIYVQFGDAVDCSIW